VGKPVGGGILTGLPPLGPFPLGAQINDGTHAEKLNDIWW
jgi:hypothetical protein